MPPLNVRLLALGCALACGCASTPRAAEPPPAPLVAPSLVAAVPADAAWLIAAPDVTRAGFELALGPVAGRIDAVRPVLTELLGRLVTDGVLPEAAATLAMVARALPVVADLLDGARLEALGVRFPMAVVAHGAPLWPVVRVSLADPARALAELDRRFAVSGEAAVRAQHGDTVAWEVSLGDLAVQVGVAGDQLVVAAWLRELGRGLAPPDLASTTSGLESADAALRQALERSGGRPDLAVGWFDLGAIATHLIGGLLSKITPGDAPEAREMALCLDEIAQLNRALPRFVFGYRSWTGAASSFAFVADLDDAEVTAAFARLGDGGAALAVEPYEAPDIAFSASLNVGRIGDLLGLLARRMASAGYACPAVRELGEQLTSAAMQVGVSGRLMLGGLRALHVRVGRWNAEAPSAFAMLTAQVVAVAVHDEPQQLLALVQRFAGVELALPRDGETVVVRETPKMVVGRSGRLVGVSLGSGAAERLELALGGGTTEPAPLLTYAVDGSMGSDDLGLVALVNETIEAAPSFPDAARVDGVLATVGEAEITATAVYAAAAVMEAQGEERLSPDALLAAALDALIDRELVAQALRRLREPTLAAAAPGDSASALVQRRLERLGKLKIGARQVQARYAEMRARVVAEAHEPPVLADITPLIEGLLASEAVVAERERLVAAQRRRSKVADQRAPAVERVVQHWGGVRELRDAVAARVTPAGGGERVEAELQVRDGHLELLGRTSPSRQPAAAPPSGE